LRRIDTIGYMYVFHTCIANADAPVTTRFTEGNTLFENYRSCMCLQKWEQSVLYDMSYPKRGRVPASVTKHVCTFPRKYPAAVQEHKKACLQW